jgi:cytochrome c-type biogenesis protein CcsB
MNYAYYSSLALVSSVVVYGAGMLAHAAEWASARKVAPELAAAPRELSMVGGGTRSEPVEAGPSTLRVDPPPPEPDPVLREPPDPTDQAGPTNIAAVRVDMFGRIGVTLTIFGFLLSVAGVVLRGLAAGRAPWGNMYEFIITAMVLLVGAYLVILWRWQVRWLGLPVTLLATVGNGLAVTVFYVAVAPLVPALHSVWFLIHIVAAAISGAAFNIGGVASILYLVKRRAEGRGEVRGYLAKLPSVQRIDTIAYRFNAFAFPMWTFTVAAGSIWAEYAWGRYWGWDPKETWALITWIIYACYLHARSTAGWRGTRAAVISIVGMASFWFNFIGINLLVSGLHSYAGI